MQAESIPDAFIGISFTVLRVFCQESTNIVERLSGSLTAARWEKHEPVRSSGVDLHNGLYATHRPFRAHHYRII